MAIETVIGIVLGVALVCGLLWAIGVAVGLLRDMQERDLNRMLRKLHEKSAQERNANRTP